MEKAYASTEDLMSCPECSALYNVERAVNEARTRMRCTSCGHARHLVLGGANTGKWTVVDPSGAVLSFTTWDDLIRSLPPSGAAAVDSASPTSGTTEPTSSDLVEERKSASASSLLDVTPTPRLTLEPESSDRLEAAAPSSAAPSSAAASGVPSSAKVQELDSDALEDAPDSIRGAGSPGDDGELVSLKDMVVVPASVDVIDDTDVEPIPSSTPPPPPAGALRTLPPTRMSAPPTIEVEDAAALAAALERQAAKETKKKEASKAAPKKPARNDDDEAAPSSAKPRSGGTTQKSPGAGPRRAAAASTPTPGKGDKDEEKGSGWLVPGVAVAAGVIGVWYFASSSQPPPDPNANKPVASAEQPPSTAERVENASSAPSATASDETASLPAPSASAAAIASASSSGTSHAAASTAAIKHGTAGDKPGPATKPDGTTEPAAKPEGAGTIADVLQRASAAKRSGDNGTAKSLYERVLRDSAGNAEAFSGLGDIARTSGDLSGAKGNYQKALAASPQYFPAVLGLADVEWDLGDKSSASARYKDIVARMGGNAPDRAKQRAGAGGAPAAD